MVERRGEGDRREPWREGTRRRRQRDRGVCRGLKAKERACSRLLQELVLRDPKATLDIWACAETGRTIFGRFLVSN